MPLFDWPYTNLHNLNLDWIIKKIKNIETAETNTAASQKASALSQKASALSAANAAGSAAQAQQYYETITENVGTLVTGWMDEHITPTTPPVDDTLTIHGAAADAKKTGDEITDLKNAFEYYNTGFQTFAGLGNFQHYGLNPDGTFMTTQQYRVSNDDAITMEYPITVNVKSGFKWGYIPVYDGTAGTWNGWHTTEQTIPYGVSFLIQIAREQENTSEIADVYEFLNAVSFTNNSEYLFTEYENRKTGVVIRDFNSFAHERGQMTSTGGNDEGEYNKQRKIRNVSPTYFNKGDVITVSNGMRAYAVGTSLYGATSSSSGWITTNYTIPYAGFYRLQIGLVSDSVIADKDITKVCSWVTFTSNLLLGDNEVYNFFKDTVTFGRKYEYTGEPLTFNKTTYDITEVLPVLPSKPAGSVSFQSTAYYNGILFVFYNPGIVLLTDYATMSVLATITTGTEHNNCASFSNEFYDESDEFPLVYLSSDNSNNDIHVTRITRTSASIVRTLRLPVDVAGYHGSNCALDLENNFLWSTGYKINDYQTAENNSMYLCCWDLGNLTNNGNGTYTPALVSKNSIPFINTTQDEKIYNGHLYVVSSNPYVGTSGYTGDNTKIYVISLDGKRISNIISNFNEPIREHETEGIAFIENGNKTVMHVSVLTGRRFDLTF